jgi:hypothetical protein
MSVVGNEGQEQPDSETPPARFGTRQAALLEKQLLEQQQPAAE